MSDTLSTIVIAAFGLAGLAMVMAAALKGWNGWLELKRLELNGGRSGAANLGTGERIEMADLKERIRKLESLAACIDL